MNFSNQQLINEAISYWSDGTLGVGSFGGEWGFHRLLRHAILELDYDKWGMEERGDDRMFLCTLDFNVLESRPGRGSLLYRRPRSRNPAPPGMLHIWDILMADWRTVKIDDYGRVEIKTVFPTSILPIAKTSKRDSIKLVLSDQEILDKQRSVYNIIHNNFFNNMNPYEKIRIMDEDIKLVGLQKKEEEIRLSIKKEIDQKIKEYWEEKDKPTINRIDDLKIESTEDEDTENSTAVNETLNLRNVDQENMNGGMGHTEYGNQNVVDQIKNQKKESGNQNVMNGF